MPPTAPDWLTRHGGSLKAGSGQSCFLMLDDQPLYAILAVPVKGRHGCTLMQTNNGKRLDLSDTADSADAALQLGLEAARKALGW